MCTISPLNVTVDDSEFKHLYFEKEEFYLLNYVYDWRVSSVV